MISILLELFIAFVIFSRESQRSSHWSSFLFFLMDKWATGLTEEQIRYPGFCDRDQSSITADFVRYTTIWTETETWSRDGGGRGGNQCTSRRKTSLSSPLLQKAHQCKTKLQNHILLLLALPRHYDILLAPLNRDKLCIVRNQQRLL